MTSLDNLPDGVHDRRRDPLNGRPWLAVAGNIAVGCRSRAEARKARLILSALAAKGSTNGRRAR